MGTVNVTLGEDTRLNLILGQQLENAVTSVVFDFSAWQTTYGTGTLALSVQRPGDDQPYAVTMTTSGTDATWSVTNLDTAYKGVGHIQLTYTVGSAIKKSVVYKFTVYESLGANGEYPSPGQTWQEEMEQEITDVRSDLQSLTLGIDEDDGLLYIYVNGVKQGEGIEIGEPTTKYNVYYELTDVTTNGKSKASEGESYNATLTANTGLTIDSVIVTMNGSDITSSAYNPSTRKISIASVTAPVGITVSAVATPDTITLSDVDSSFRSELEALIPVINTSNPNSLNFVVITDTHGSANGQKSQNVVRYLLKNSRANKCFWLGDMCNVNWSLSEYQTFALPLLNCSEKIYPTLGNHEYFGSGDDLDQIYDDFLADKTLQGESESFYYYIDDTIKKVRFLVINTSDGGRDIVTSTQLAWLENAVTLPSPDWGIIVFSHYPFDERAGTSGGVQLYSSYCKEIQDALSTTNGTIISHFCGHVHDDYTTILEPLFYEQRLKNDSVSGQAISIINIDLDDKLVNISRIGVGEDISYNYTDFSDVILYSVANNLSHCTNSNNKTQVLSGNSYKATLTADTNYDLTGMVTITMGGNDITSTAYNETTHAINISEVTGNISITANPAYVVPIEEYEAEWLVRDTSVAYPKFVFSSQETAASGFPTYLTFIMCNQNDAFPTGFRNGSDNTYARYASRTSGWTTHNYELTTEIRSATGMPTVTVDGKYYAYCTFTKAQSDSAYALLQQAVSGGEIATEGGIKLIAAKASSLDSNFDYWVIAENVDATNIESVIRRLPEHT